MNNSLLFKIIIVLLVISWSSISFARIEMLASRIVQAYEKGEPIPTLSEDDAVDMSSAYEIQAAVVKNRLKKDKIAGFKAGLTSHEAQLHFGMNRPIFGVLFKSGDLSEHGELSLKRFHYLMVETELGFIIKKPIRKTVQSLVELKSYVGQIVPVVELPDVGFSKNPFTAADLVAGNTGSGGYIINKKINWNGQDINSISVSLLHNGVIVNQGQTIDALGDQWEALRWLVNQVISQGWTIEKDNLLITGALGKMLPVQKGTYQAKFNDIAVLDVTFVK